MNQAPREQPYVDRSPRKPLYVQVVTQPALHGCWSVNISETGIGLTATPRTRSEGPREGEELELELIDHGLLEMGEGKGENGEAQIVIRCAFNDFGQMEKALEAKGLAPLSAETEYIPTTPTELPEDKATEVLKMVDALEQDDDVQRVFHNLA